jgi:hypothetical protein
MLSILKVGRGVPLRDHRSSARLRTAEMSQVARIFHKCVRTIDEVERRPPPVAVVGALVALVVAALAVGVATAPSSRASERRPSAAGNSRASRPSTDPPQPTPPSNAHPALPTTPVGSLPVLGSTTTAQIATFTHPRTGIWMTPSGLTLTLAGYLNDYGLAEFPSTYGGLTASGDDITVHLTTLNATTEAAFRSVTPAGTLHFVPTPHTWAFVIALRNVVQSYWNAVTAQGVELVGFGPSVQTGTVTLQVENPTPRSVAILDTMFGAGNITVTQGYPLTFGTP